MAIISNTKNKCWQGCSKKGILTYSWWQCKFLQTLWKAVWRVLKKLKTDLPYDPAIPLLGIYPKECKPAYNKATCTCMFMAVHNSQALHIAQMLPQLMNALRKCGTHTHTHTHTGVLFGHKEE
jgi:hypothetical protein